MAQAAASHTLDRRGLRRRLLLLFLALATPTVVLVWQAFSEMKWEAFHRHRQLAEELAGRIDESYAQLIGIEERRSFTDFAFLNVVGEAGANLLQRSPLAAYPVVSPIPGAIGYFQIDPGGRFSTPYLPEESAQASRYGISAAELDQRAALALRIRRVLSENSLVAGAPTEPEMQEARERTADEDAVQSASPARTDSRGDRRTDSSGSAALPQAAFDLLKRAPGPVRKYRSGEASQGIGRLEDLQLAQPFADSQPEPSSAAARAKTAQQLPAKRQIRKERSQLPAGELDAEERKAATWPSQVPVTTFESELDRYQFSRLDERHFVLFRNVWRSGKRYVQGLLIEGGPFIEGRVAALFQPSLLAAMSDLLLAYRGDVQKVFGTSERYDYFSSNEMQGALLYRTALSTPLDEIDLLFTIRHLPPGSGSPVIAWSAALLLLVLCGGLWMIYRLGLRQIELARQQQEFVSAVSHELKTPLTSIRMYGEMLMKGWVDEARRATYYRYIFEEGERLSRLIDNVLQFARMNRGQHRLELAGHSVGALFEELVPKLAAQTERAGFQLRIDCDDAVRAATVRIDKDALTQVLINLVDNAVKFAAGCDRREVEVGCRALGRRHLRLWVRDYGPGVARDQRSKIFTMFYRSEDEMTRETHGTGIGLALVQRLVAAMQGSIEVVDRKPGAEFRVDLPRHSPAKPGT